METMNALPKDLLRIIFAYLTDKDLFKIMDMIDPNDIFWKEMICRKLSLPPEGMNLQYIWERMYYQNIISHILWCRDVYWVKRMCDDEVFLARHVNIEDMHGSTLLQHVVRYRHPDKVKKILTHGKNIDLRYCVVTAAMDSSSENIKMLLDAGADVNHNTGNYNRTVLLQAASIGLIENVKLLLEYGADVTRFDTFGKNAYDLAMEGGYHEVAEFLKPFFFSSSSR